MTSIVELHKHLMQILEKQQMSKPWDKLRAPSKNPIRPGQWMTEGNTPVVLRDDVSPTNIGVTVGSARISGLLPESARQLGEFLIAMADQAEGK